jgi:hypothetical protein
MHELQLNTDTIIKLKVQFQRQSAADFLEYPKYLIYVITNSSACEVILSASDKNIIGKFRYNI